MLKKLKNNDGVNSIAATLSVILILGTFVGGLIKTDLDRKKVQKAQKNAKEIFQKDVSENILNRIDKNDLPVSKVSLESKAHSGAVHDSYAFLEDAVSKKKEGRFTKRQRDSVLIKAALNEIVLKKLNKEDFGADFRKAARLASLYPSGTFTTSINDEGVVTINSKKNQLKK